MSFFTMVKTDFKIIFKDYITIGILVLLPIILLYFFVSAFIPGLMKSSFVEPFKISVVDMEDSATSRLLLGQLEEFKVFNEIINENEKSAKERLLRDETAAIIIIPVGFSKSVYYGENKPIEVIGNGKRPIRATTVKNLIGGATNLVSVSQKALNAIYHFYEISGMKKSELSENFSRVSQEMVLKSLSRKEIFISSENTKKYDVTPAEYGTAAIIVIFMMFSGMPLVKMLLYERKNGITNRLNIASISTLKRILAKFSVTFFIGILQFAGIMVFTSLIFKNYWGTSILNLLLLLLTMVFSIACFSVFISALATTEGNSNILGILGILIMSVLGGNIYPITEMPDIVEKISTVTINRWAMEGFMTVFSGGSIESLMNPLYSVLVIGIVFLILGLVVEKSREKI